MSERVVLGLSGGVDSAVAATLLKEQGLDVLGLYLETGAPGVEDAAAAARALNIPLKILDARPRMEEYVCRPFAESYLRGETPNPCILCNPAVKFASLLEYADEIGAEYIATGHYAVAHGGKIFRGSAENDQSYMLCRLTEAQLCRLLLPLGPYSKNEVRRLAEERRLPVASKPDSMEICFIPDKDYAAFIERRGTVPPVGRFVLEGKAVGTHRGIHHYTVGQRRHLGESFGHRVYVSDIRPETNEVILANADEELKKTEVRLRDVHWIAPLPKDGTVGVRIRHSRAEMPLARWDGECLHFLTPVRAPTPGQTAALYCGDQLLGGGFIQK